MLKKESQWIRLGVDKVKYRMRVKYFVITLLIGVRYYFINFEKNYKS